MITFKTEMISYCRLNFSLLSPANSYHFCLRFLDWNFEHRNAIIQKTFQNILGHHFGSFKTKPFIYPLLITF